MVDEKKTGFNPAVELSYLNKDEQELLPDEIAKEEASGRTAALKMPPASKKPSILAGVRANQDLINSTERKATAKDVTSL